MLLFFRIFDKKLFSCSISIIPAVKYPNYLLERYAFLLVNYYVNNILVPAKVVYVAEYSDWPCRKSTGRNKFH